MEDESLGLCSEVAACNTKIALPHQLPQPPPRQLLQLLRPQQLQRQQLQQQQRLRQQHQQQQRLPQRLQQRQLQQPQPQQQQRQQQQVEPQRAWCSSCRNQDKCALTREVVSRSPGALVH